MKNQGGEADDGQEADEGAVGVTLQGVLQDQARDAGQAGSQVKRDAS